MPFPKPVRRFGKRAGASLRRLLHATLPHLPASAARAALRAAHRIGLERYTAPRERATCPACDSRLIEHIHPLHLHGCEQGRWVGFASGCTRCGLVFSNPMPRPATLEHLYSPEGAWGRPRQEGAAHEKNPPRRYFIELFTPVRESFLLEGPPPGSAALDFGCGNGEMLDILQDLGWETYGIEPAEKRAFRRHRELAAIPAEPRFGLILAHHVLEHVIDPMGILRALAAGLTPGGLLLVSVPRLDALPDHRDYSYCINDRAHILSYTSDAMAALLGMAGLTPIDLHGDASTTNGWRPRRRLRMLGRKDGGSAMAARNPLEAARRALRAWSPPDPADAPLFSGRIPVRAAAAIMNFEREIAHELRRPPRPADVESK